MLVGFTASCQTFGMGNYVFTQFSDCIWFLVFGTQETLAEIKNLFYKRFLAKAATLKYFRHNLKH